MDERVALSLDPDSIENVITATLQDMAKIYEMPPTETLKCVKGKEMSFADGKDYQGLINTAEALECFFMPYFGVKGIREKFWDEELINLEYIANGIRYLVEDFKEDPDNDGLLKLSGTPYMNFKFQGASEEESGIEHNLDFLDTACFLLPCLLDAKAISVERQYMIEEGLLHDTTPEIIPKDLLSKVDQRITDAAMFLRRCDLGPGRGWAYTNDPMEPNRQDQLYFTWNALESLEVFQAYVEESNHLVPRAAIDEWGGDKAIEFIQRKFAEKLSYLSAKFLSPDNKNLYICKNKVDFGADDQLWYYNLFAVISLLITGVKDTESIGSSLKYLLTEFEKPPVFEKLKKVESGEFFIAGDPSFFDKHKKVWYERAIFALLIKALALFKKQDQEKFNSMMKDLDAFSSEDVLLTKYLDAIDNDRFIVEEHSLASIWDKQIPPPQYSIYYTERVIESLVKLYTVHYPNRKVDSYYKKLLIKQPDVENLTPFSAQSVQITIDGDWIKENLLKQTTKEIDNKVKEILNSGNLNKWIKDEVNKHIGKLVDHKIDKFFEFIWANLSEGKIDKKYKIPIENLKKIIKKSAGDQFIEILSICLGNVAKESNLEIDEKKFLAGFEKAMVYVAEWENRPVSIDWGLTFSEMATSSIIKFSNADPKKEPNKNKAGK